MFSTPFDHLAIFLILQKTMWGLVKVQAEERPPQTALQSCSIKVYTGILNHQFGAVASWLQRAAANPGQQTLSSKSLSYCSSTSRLPSKPSSAHLWIWLIAPRALAWVSALDIVCSGCAILRSWQKCQASQCRLVLLASHTPLTASTACVTSSRQKKSEMPNLIWWHT